MAGEEPCLKYVQIKKKVIEQPGAHMFAASHTLV